MILGIDTGGTFTDFVLWDGVQIRTHKVLSTPHAPEEAILQGVAALGVARSGLTIVHGSTVATNGLLEGKGARTLYIGNRGLADLLTIGRQARTALYDLHPPPIAPPVPAEDCLEVGGRTAADGSEIEPLTTAELQRLVQEVVKRRPQAVAINLLFSFLDSGQEQRIEAAMPPELFVSRSSAVLPEYREYERGIATWLNSYVGPLMAGYLQRLEQGVAGANLSIMQSCGSTVSASQAATRGVHLLLSGPAGGLAAAREIGQQLGRERLLTFDMGGTSTDVALIDGEIALTAEGRIGRYPVAVPMVDMHTIGSGGGSIAWIDGGGMLQVGPESAGAVPGPACYGQGGERPTVTDANLLLGRLLPDHFLGGEMRLDRKAAERAMAPLAEELGTTLEGAAEGVIRVVNEQMAHALRVISVQRGIDPRGFSLLSFGGAGGLHVCDLAEALGLERALVPPHGGVLSALGMLVAPRGRELSRSWIALLQELTHAEVEQQLNQLAAAGEAALVAEGVEAAAIDHHYRIDLRYCGQSFTLTLPWQEGVACAERFHQAHRARYGHRLEFPVELVNLRVRSVERREPVLRLGGDSVGEAVRAEPVAMEVGAIAVVDRAGLDVGERVGGPALIVERNTTTRVAPGWIAVVDPSGTLMLNPTPDAAPGR